MSDNVILIGFMGAGKTSVGILFSKIHKMDFLDTDSMIEQAEGMAVSEIFAGKGEQAFRAMETETLKKLLQREKPALISVGGGLPMRAENRELLKELGTVVYLSVSPDTVLTRLKGDTTRPLLKGDHVEEKVEKLLCERGPVYEEASHLKIDGNGKEPEAIVEEIHCFLRKQKGERA